MGEHQLAEAADQGKPDQPARSGMGGGAADIAQADAGHAHHQQGEQQQREAQTEEAEVMVRTMRTPQVMKATGARMMARPKVCSSRSEM